MTWSTACMNAFPAERIAGLYVHVPFCDGKCDYCAFYSAPYDAGLVEGYLRAVAEELDEHRRDFGTISPRTVYIGGGTPTILAAAQLSRLCDVLCARIDTRRLVEWTVEANPGTVSGEKLRGLRAAGVNRISIGAQSFSAPVLRRLGRRHTAAEIGEAVEAARSSGFPNIGVDLIAGVPGLQASEWHATLEAAISLKPEHLSIYALTVEEGSMLAARIESGGGPPYASPARETGRCAGVAASERPLDRAPEAEPQLDALEAAEKRLGAAGYARYEISNYARPGYECRHNLDCWRGEAYLGLGPAASSHVPGRRWTTAADVAAYTRGARLREEEEIPPLTKATELLVFGLRMAEGVDLQELCRAAGLVEGTQETAWRGRLSALEKEGLVCRRGARWALTAEGRNLADHVAVELMP